MVQLYQPIAEYKDVITSTGITLDDCNPQKTIKRFIRLLKQIEEPRLTGMLVSAMCRSSPWALECGKPTTLAFGCKFL